MATYRYDGADRLVEMAYANLAKTLRVYDAAGQLESLKHLRAGGTLHAETYVHDGNGNRTSLTVEDGSTPQVTTYTYDVADRLVSEVSSTRRVLDTLDAAGNRVDRLIQDGAGVLQQRLVYTVNARDQVTGIETRNGANAVTGTEVLVYDANGNRIGRSVGGVTQTHRYDRRNRELARGGVRYEHNDADVRTAQVDGSLRTEWVMDGLSLQAEVRGGTTVAQYRYGRELIGEVRGAVGRTILSDGHRSPVVVLESTGNVTDRVRYSAGGEVQARTGSSPLAFGYGGYLTQAGTEELYAFARTYRPGLARFNEVDPLRSFDAQLGMGSHRYVLGYGNPIRYVDPDGRIGFLTTLRDRFDESDRILRDMAEGSDSEFGFALASGARAFMSIGSAPARATNLASDLLAASLKPPKFAGVREDARRNLAPLGAALANPGDTAIAAYNQAVQTTTLVMEGDRGAASDLMVAGLETFAGGAVVKAGRFVDDVGRSAHLDLEMRDIDRQMYADAGTPRVVVERSGGDVANKLSRSDLGALLGRGGNKDVFAYGDVQAIGVLRAGKNPSILTEELGLLRQLDELGLPTVNARGPILVDDQPALMFDRFAQGSKDVVRLQDGRIRVVGESPLLNQQSVADLQRIRQTMVNDKIRINDLQFLIGQNGRVVVADPLGVQVGVAPSKNNLRMIDLLIQQAQKGG